MIDLNNDMNVNNKRMNNIYNRGQILEEQQRQVVINLDLKLNFVNKICDVYSQVTRQKVIVMKQKISEVNDRVRRKSQSGSKSKSKSKGKTIFDPVKFLHAQMNIPAPKYKNPSKNNPKIQTSHNTTPIPSLNKKYKSRTKSSYSQYRRRDTPLMNDLFNLNISNILTQQDCIRYTEMISNDPSSEQINPLKNKPKLSQEQAATIIQRQWRRSKTLTMVKKYYEYYREIEKDSEKVEQLELQKTLKIKSGIKTQNLCNFTRKNSKECMRQMIQDSIETPSPKIIHYKQNNALDQMKEIQAKRCHEVMQLIEQQTKQNQYDTVLNQLLKKLQENKNILQKDIQSQNNSIFQTPSVVKIQNHHDNSIHKQQQNQVIQNQQLQVQKHIGQQSAQCKLLNKRINRIKEMTIIQVAKLVALRQIGSISQKEANHKINKLNEKNDRQVTYLESIIKSYYNVIDAITNVAIQQHKLRSHSKSNSKFRKSFSADSIVLKKILQEDKIVCQNFVIVSPSNQKRQIQQLQQFSSCQSKHFIDDESDNLIVIDSSQIQRDLSDSFMRVCSENFQMEVESRLIQEITQQIYMSQRFYQPFKLKVETPIQFHAITDFQIKNFLNKISQFTPPTSVLLYLFNQKINPSPSEILKIIRDEDCQLEQYQIILSENVFHQYRKWGDQKFEESKISFLAQLKDVESWVKNTKVIDKIEQRIANKKSNYLKFMQFQRDLKTIYLKSVFNCLNEYLIQHKSLCTYMNARSSIGPGQLTMALKEYNKQSTEEEVVEAIQYCKQRIIEQLRYKCVIPNFGNPNNIKLFYKMSQKQLQIQLNINEHKWVNLMDQSLQVWIDITICITNTLLQEVAREIMALITQN